MMTHPLNHQNLVDLNGASILVTGGTGSFGQSFIKRILELYKPRRLIVFSRDELKQFEMAQELQGSGTDALRYFIGDVRDSDRLEMAMRDVDYVVHAAALKQVTTAEYNPFECINTNVIGAENVARAAISNGVKKVIALSTDKAVSPINLYGASKLASDKIFVAANHLSGTGRTRFSVVRYGNVIGSRGSVLPFFQRLINEGTDSLPITDERMTRFWITLQHGIDFVLSNLEIMRGGEIFVPKIPSMKVTELARCLAPNLSQKVIGIRPGEKLHEAMITNDDARSTFDLGDRYVIEPSLAMYDRESFADTGGKRVPEGFEYTSDGNDEWLSSEAMKKLL
jgi:UDP-N-acetylglucosamine 4,6-dehydratase/5-epimerase